MVEAAIRAPHSVPCWLTNLFSPRDPPCQGCLMNETLSVTIAAVSGLWYK